MRQSSAVKLNVLHMHKTTGGCFPLYNGPPEVWTTGVGCIAVTIRAVSLPLLSNKGLVGLLMAYEGPARKHETGRSLAGTVCLPYSHHAALARLATDSDLAAAQARGAHACKLQPPAVRNVQAWFCNGSCKLTVWQWLKQ
jgi:hypothetical protein